MLRYHSGFSDRELEERFHLNQLISTIGPDAEEDSQLSEVTPEGAYLPEAVKTVSSNIVLMIIEHLSQSLR